MAKRDKSAKKQGKAKGSKAERRRAADSIPPASPTGADAHQRPGLPRVTPPALLLTAGALIVGAASAALRLRR